MSDGVRIVDILGGGAFATVVVVERPGVGLRALKVLRPDRLGDMDALYRFRDEARMLQRVDHPHVVHCHGLHRHGRRLVMELDYVDGAGLDELLASGDPHKLSVRQACELVAQVAEALRAVFEDPFDGAPLRIVHRDLKPANLVLDRHGIARVLDFGIAKGEFDDREAMSLYDVGGSMGFIAPERRDGGETPAVDVYALGVLLLLLVSGERLLLPMRSDRHTEAVAQRVEALELPESVAALAPLLRAMIAFEPSERPGMAEVVEATKQVAASAGGDDLASLAAHWVPRVQQERPKVAVAEHRRFPEVAFLEKASAPEAPAPGRAATRRELHRRLASVGWLKEVVAIAELRGAVEPPVDGPLLDRLDLARPSWWQVLSRPTQPEELEQLLLILGDRPSPATMVRAERLAQHPDERVRRAAALVLKRGESG